MRLWSIHPGYLDVRGLTAVWREGLLAQAVLRGRTAGYRRHPQLARFRAARDPLASIARYLEAVHDEAARRGYRFDRGRIGRRRPCRRLPVTSGQLECEWRHLQSKLAARDPAWLQALDKRARPTPHPLFRPVAGPVEPWEAGARRR